ncbi:universal stress protein [Micromonospora sp. WMMD812]|uniref:universal stress protein n=1 Tax=Micromonospora sp. WMMD812 TaxID=3015152 RepID=UPI00248D070C|nr:universal stress protein [Micromonospora sp. WMMD812]WBB70169.1 universal stress protein [Micromonospora sp. WMMD812]
MAASAGPGVLVGLGSDRDLPMVRLAAQEAAAHRRPLHLVHAFDWNVAFEAETVAASRDEAEDLIARANDLARDVEPELTVSGEIAEGATVPVLLRRAEHAFLLAVGDGGMADCEDCVRPDALPVQFAARAGCPVLVARSEPPPQGPVLVGVDCSSSSHAMLDWAFTCAARRGARLLAVRVVDAGASVDDASRELAAVVAQHTDRHPDVLTECHTIRGDPGIVLIDQSRSAQVALVAARGDEPGRGMLGAVAQSLLYHAPAPVIVVRGVTGTAPHGA